MVFNNRVGSNYSTVNIFQPAFDTYMWAFQKSGNKFLPNNFSISNTEKMFFYNN